MWFSSNYFFPQGYLYSSTVDFLAEDPASLSYTWLLMITGFILPNIFIISSHVFVCHIYRSVGAPVRLFLIKFTRSNMRECLEQMGGLTRKEFLIQRLEVK